MSKWDEIRTKCPRLYQQTIPIECGLGWFDLIMDLSVKIEEILEKNAKRDVVPPEEEIYYFEMFAVQVKEKYGTLRFYMSSETDEISDLIHEAEIKSAKTCEICGSPGDLKGACWREVRCPKC